MCFLRFHRFLITNHPVLIRSAVCSGACVAMRRRFPLFQPTVKVTAPPMRPACIRQLSAAVYQAGHKPRATKVAAPPGAETKKKDTTDHLSAIKANCSWVAFANSRLHFSWLRTVLNSHIFACLSALSFPLFNWKTERFQSAAGCLFCSTVSLIVRP